MATNPETVVPSTPPPQGDAARQAQGRVAIREYLRQNKGKATLKGVTDLAAAFGLDLTDPKIVNAAVKWANRKDTDIDLLQITTDPLAPATGDAAQTEIATPEAPSPQPAPTELEAFYTGAADVFAREPSLGLDPENRQYVESLGALGRHLYAPVGDIGAGALTTIQAGLEGAGLAAGQYMENIGLLNLIEQATGVKQTPEYAQRQFLGMLESEGLRAPMGYVPPGYAVATGRVPVSPMRMAQALERAEPLPVTAPPTPMARIAQAPEPLPTRAPRAAAAAPTPAPEVPTPARAPVIPQPTVAAPPRQPVVPTATMTAPQRAAALQTLEQKGLTQPIMEHGLSKKAASFAADYLNEAKLTRPEDVPFTQFFYDHFAAGTLPDNVVQDLYKKYDMDYLDIVEASTGLRASASELGRGLGLLSIISRRVPTAAAELAKAGVRSQPDPSVWVRAGNAMRGLMVSQIATTMRNLVSTGLRVGLDPYVATVDNVINMALNPVRKLRGQDAVPVNPLDAFVLVTQQFKGKQKDEIFRQLANAQPKISKKLLSAYSPDVTRPILNDKFGKVEKAVDMLNIFNRASEYVVRRAAFPAFLRREAQRKGLDFDALANNNQLHTIPKEIMEKALNETLDLVYARKPSEGGPLFLGKSAKKVVDFIEDLGPVGAAVIGFPNFIANALRYQFEHSPVGFLRFLSKKERARLMKGDSDVMGKAVVGSAMLYAAMQFQDSEYAGSKWYNARLPNGKEIDLRPFFPIAPYLLVADLIKRYEDGTLDVAYTAADIVQGFSGAQFRAGGGLYAVDQLIRDMVQAGSLGEGAMAAIKGLLGSSLGSLLTPMSTLKDVIAQFRPEEAVVRDTSEAPFLGQVLRTVPFAQTELLDLPEQQYVSQEAPRTTDDPLLRQLTGAAIRPAPTIIQDEMRDLGFEDYDLYKKEGFPDLDLRAKELIGSIAEYNADAYFGSEAYQSADSLTKREMFKEFYSGVRATARDIMRAENPNYSALMWFNDQSREDKIRLNKQYDDAVGLDFKKFYSQLISAPIPQTQEEFDALPAGTKYTDPGDYKVYTKK